MENPYTKNIVLTSVWKWLNGFYQFLILTEWHPQTNTNIYSQAPLASTSAGTTRCFPGNTLRECKTMTCAEDSLVKPKNYNAWSSQESSPQLIWISLNHQSWALLLSHSAWDFWLPSRTSPLTETWRAWCLWSLPNWTAPLSFMLATSFLLKWPPALQKHWNADANPSLSWALSSLSLFSYRARSCGMC